MVHGIHLVGLQTALQQRIGVPGLQSYAILNCLQYATVQLRVRAKLQRCC